MYTRIVVALVSGVVREGLCVKLFAVKPAVQGRLALDRPGPDVSL